MTTELLVADKSTVSELVCVMCADSVQDSSIARREFLMADKPTILGLVVAIDRMSDSFRIVCTQYMQITRTMTIKLQLQSCL